MPRVPITVAVYQAGLAGVPPAGKLDRLGQAIARGPHADLVVCPELFQSDYRAGQRLRPSAEAAEEFAQGVAGIAAAHDCAIAYGYPEATEGRLHNSARVIASDGRTLANHRKLRLPGEYENTWFTCGDRLTDFALGDWRLAVLICYDIEFPELVRSCARRGAHLMIAPTALSDDWSVVSEKIVPARAFENGVFVAYANHAGRDSEFRYLGGSCIVGPDGRDRVRAGREEGLHAARLLPQDIAGARAKLKYLEDSQDLARLA
ncbi:MAG: carbon-nitrogen hydrolase family protein [Pseudomonadota bacterium]